MGTTECVKPRSCPMGTGSEKISSSRGGRSRRIVRFEGKYKSLIVDVNREVALDVGGEEGTTVNRMAFKPGPDWSIRS